VENLFNQHAHPTSSNGVQRKTILNQMAQRLAGRDISQNYNQMKNLLSTTATTANNMNNDSVADFVYNSSNYSSKAVNQSQQHINHTINNLTVHHSNPLNIQNITIYSNNTASDKQ
jgi:hypothetical protein